MFFLKTNKNICLFIVAQFLTANYVKEQKLDALEMRWEKMYPKEQKESEKNQKYKRHKKSSQPWKINAWNIYANSYYILKLGWI